MHLMIDNYDSFTFNVVQALGQLGAEITVVRNDRITVAEALALDPESVIISPGPGTPSDAGVSVELIRACAGRVPVLGICLGHQSIVAAFGGRISRAERVMHGKTSRIHHDGGTIYAGLSNPFIATRYHSLLVREEDVPAELEIVARTAGGEVMGVRHRTSPSRACSSTPSRSSPPRARTCWPTSWPRPRRRGAAMLARLLEGAVLDRDEARALMGRVMAGEVPPVQLAAMLTALRLRGETVDEITGFAEAMRAAAVTIPAGDLPDLVDTCGTGGDGAGTFNISTATALLAAAMGIPVAKHGNRAVSSRSGSADVLEALGVGLDVEPARVAALIREVGIGFLFAPALHPAMRHAMPVRRELGVRTVFNLLGPLTNPAGARRQLLGVYDPRLCEPVARVLQGLGSERAFVVHGAGGLDEVSPCGETLVAELKDGAVTTWTFTPEEAGLPRCDPALLAGANPPATPPSSATCWRARTAPPPTRWP